MKIKIAGQKSEDVKEFKVSIVEGELVITDATEGWDIAGLRVVKDGKIALVRYHSIQDKDYLTDSDGRISEVPE